MTKSALGEIKHKIVDAKSENYELSRLKKTVTIKETFERSKIDMKEIHLICNAHIDPIWQWDWQEGVSAVLSTFQSAVNIADEYDYVFCHNEVTVYKYVEEYAPDLFERIKELVKKGKWRIMGGWYLQPDCNMPSGESFVRQIQEGKRYFTEKFGVFPTTAINFDPFGHTVGLVQIIKKCGQDSYLFMRPYASEMPMPSQQFLWRGLDGSTIKGTRTTGGYNSKLGEAVKAITAKADHQPEDVAVVLWGVGNHGGGPSMKDVKEINEQLLTKTDEKYIHSYPENFFARMTPAHEIDHSLRISMPGCYTSMGRIKRKHALLESELAITEKMLSTALSCGLLKSYPEEKLHEIVQDLLNAEFHDVLPGTSVQCGEDNGMKLLDHGLLEVERLKTRAYFALSALQEPSKEGEFPLLIFNPNVYEIEENIECEFMLADQNWNEEMPSSFRLYDENGAEVPFQTIKEESNLNLDWRKRIIFRGKLKPLQLTRFSLYVDYGIKGKDPIEESYVYDDGRKYVEIDRETGLLKRYAIDGVDYVTDGFRLVSFDDNADPWAMARSQLTRVGENESAFALSKNTSGVFKNLKSVQVIENGEIYLGIEAFFEKDETRARIGYKIYKNNDYVDVDVTVFMGDVDKFIKLKVPVCNGNLMGQTAFGTEPMFMDARENVAHRFLSVDCGEKSLVLMNTGTYGSHYENGAIYLSLVRGVSYCAHPIQERQLIPTDRFVKKIDQGENNFSFRLAVVPTAQVERATQEFVQKPYGLNIFPTKVAESALAGRKDFSVSLSDDVISVVTIKKADGRDALLFRLLNNTKDGVDTALTVNGAMLPLSFGKYEVKTVSWDGVSLKEEMELLI